MIVTKNIRTYDQSYRVATIKIYIFYKKYFNAQMLKH